MKTIAALITCFNRKEKTILCLTNLFKQPLLNNFELDVFLTDDGCTDGTAEAVGKTFPQVHIIKGDGNLFWNRGMYIAWQAAIKEKDYDFYLWLNDDTYLKPTAIKQLLLSSNECLNKSVIIGSTSAIGNDKEITYGGRTKAKGLLTPNGHLQPCELINGNIVLIPRYVYQQVGTNDPYFLHAIGDNDYGYRVIEAGLKNMVAPEILGECDLHEQPDTWRDSSKPLRVRWKALRKPTGIQPEQFFVYEYRHYGLFIATFHYITTNLHAICPWIWKLKQNEEKYFKS